MAETLIPNCTQRIPSHLPSPARQFPLPIQSLHINSNPNRPVRSLLTRHRPAAAAAAAAPYPAVETKRDDDEESVSIDALRRFIELNLGKWNGTFYQFDAYGNLLQEVSTKLAVSSYGEDELISLIQSLYIKQPCGSGDDGEAEWFEYKIKETNMFTVDKYQQIGLFPKEKAFALRYQTAGMLETILRQGVLGEDDTGEESPKNLKLPSKRPSIICENCLYSLKKDMRARAFHVMDPKGILEMLIVFIEVRGEDVPFISSAEEISNRITPLLGRWEGHSITKRSGIYGATIEEAQTVALLEMDDEDRLVQDITTTSGSTGTRTNVHWAGEVSNNLVTFDGGFQVSLLPGGMYMGCPSDIGKSVVQLQSFHLEFCWMESADKRQRLVRTYDMEGLAVSSTYISETKGVLLDFVGSSQSSTCSIWERLHIPCTRPQTLMSLTLNFFVSKPSLFLGFRIGP